MRKAIAFVGLIVVAALLAAVIAGCGGTRLVNEEATASARFAGSDACGGCHSGTAAEYARTGGDLGHGMDFRVHARGDLTTGSCAPCHTVGYGETSGYVDDGSTPHLVNIGCEECHGRGSEHAADPSSSNIMGVPDAQESCWHCHVSSYKQITDDPASMVVTDAKFYGTKPSSVSVHHPQALFLVGGYGYNHDVGSDDNPHLLIENTCVTCHANSDQVALHASGEAYHGEHDLAPDASSCAPCHGGVGGAQTEFEEFEEWVKDELIDLAGDDGGEPDASYGGGMIRAFINYHGIDPASNSNPDDPNVKALKGVLHNLSFILHDVSWGAHNPPFMESMLEEMKDLMEIP